ncbi:MAG: DASH family cryptochrome [Saprospiraceae bacterium]
MKTGIVWFRNDLRVQDNYSLQRAVEENDRVIGVYCFEPQQFAQTKYGFRKTEKFRAKFLRESVAQLQADLYALNISLVVAHDLPETVIPAVGKEYAVKNIYLQRVWTAEEVAVQAQVAQAVAGSMNWTEAYDQFLFHPEDLVFSTDNVPQVFTQFRKKCEKYSPIRACVEITACAKENLLSTKSKIPSLSELGFADFEVDERSAFPFKGGTKAAEERMEHYFWETKNLSRYKKTRNGLVGLDYSSKLSAWLANGSISPRQIYAAIKAYEQENGANDSTYWLVFELIWRDYFKYISLQHGNLIFQQGGILRRQYHWKKDSNLIQQWMDGTTKEPFVNANMIELKKTGWMSNRGRQNVASYFAKNLELDWRIGAAYFESLLIDYDVDSNYGNWMYVAGVGNDPRDRKFNVRLQASRYDAAGIFQRLWLTS